MYSMKDLSSRVKRTPQALYTLIKQNEELSSIVKQNKEQNGRFIKYGEPVLQWLINYYQIEEPTEDDAGEAIGEPAAVEIPDPTPPERPTDASLQTELIRLTVENEALKTTIEGLKSDLERERTEKRELREQLGISLLALRDEQKEKQLYLPPPRKSLKDFFKTIFTRETINKKPPEDPGD